jgi:hypothetical protein
MISPRSPWYGRLKILAVLVVIVLADIGVLVSYRGFADQRVAALEEEKKDLEAKRDAAQQAVQRLDGSIKRLASLQEGLESFYYGTLGSRRDRLAPLIDEIHGITKKAGLVPDSIAYSEQAAPGGETIRLSFSVTSTYPEVKKLLATFESSARFLVVDSFTIGVDQSGSDLITVGFSLSHYFREGIGRKRAPVERASKELKPQATAKGKVVRVPDSAPTPSAVRVVPDRDFAPRPTRVPRGQISVTEEAVPSSGPGAGPAGPGQGPGGGLLLPRVGTAPGVARPRPTSPPKPEGAR